MVTERNAYVDSSLSQYAALADDDHVTRTAAALEGNGIGVLRAWDAREASRTVLDLIPEGSQVHHGASLVTASASGSQLGALRRRRRQGDPPRGHAEDRVRPRRGVPSHRRVRLPARGRPRRGGVRPTQRREQGPDVNRELTPGRITVVFVDETLGF
jgi:hypothetical protein